MITTKLPQKAFGIAILMLVFLKGLQAQPKNVIKLNTLSLGVATLSGFYERAIHKQWSIQVGFSHTPNIQFPWTNALQTTYGGIGEARFYPKKQSTALQGLYVSGFLRYHHWQTYYNLSGDERIRTSYGSGFSVGYQKLLFKNHLSIDLFAGPHLSKHILQTYSQLDKDDRRLVNPAGLRVGACIGFAF